MRFAAAAFAILAFAGPAAAQLPGQIRIYQGPTLGMVWDYPLSHSNTAPIGNVTAWGGTGTIDSGIATSAGKLSIPSSIAGVSSSEQQAIVWLQSTAPATNARYGVLGVVTYGPTSGSPWSSTLEGLIGLAYMQAAGTHNDYIMGVGGTAFLCDPSIAPVCSPSTVLNQTGTIAGIYGSAEVGGAGTASLQAGVWADAANNIVHGGATSLKNIGLYVTRPLAGTKRYGIFFGGGAPPDDGSIAANADISINPGSINAVTFKNAGAACGGELFSTNSGAFLSSQGTDCGTVVSPNGTGWLSLGTTTPGSVNLLYAATAASVPGNFSATHRITMRVNGVLYEVPAMAAGW